MNAAERLRSLIIYWQGWFSILLSLPLAFSVPELLLLDDSLKRDVSRTLFLAMLLAGALAAGHAWLATSKHQLLLRTLGLGAGAILPDDVQRLAKEPWRMTRIWITPHIGTLLLFNTPLRPSRMDDTTAMSVTLLGSLMVAAAALPLHAVFRAAFLRAIELVPREVAQAMIATSEHTPEAQTRITRRLVAAVATPIFFVALGCALIVNAHLRRADERSREITASALAYCSLEPGPGIVDGAGLGEAIERGKSLGFTGMVSAKPASYKLLRGDRGVSMLTTPLDKGSAQVLFNISTVGLLGIRPLLLAILAVFVATLLGLLLGQSLSNDLFVATRRLRLLGTESVLSGAKAMRYPARFAIVQELGQAVEQLAARFRMFARAQEDAILGREAAIRMRSMFFASASHDLKSPLNAILGFTELVRREPLNDGQAESLHAIQSRGRELLALIETILDAARVEAGQLSLMYDEVPFTELYAAVLDRTRQLSGDYPLQIWDEIQPDIPSLLVDRIHLSRALSTFVAYSVRSTQGGKMRLRAEMDDSRHLRIDVDFPSQLYSAKELEKMLARVQSPGKRAHRGMALGLRLARAVIELHKGSVRIIDRGSKGAMFCITLQTIEAAPSATPPPTVAR